MKNLKTLRNQHNLSQQKLADILHISQQSIYKYENDLSSPDLSTLILIADYFETSIDYLIGHSDIPHKIELVTDTMLNQDELRLVEYYRQLSANQKTAVIELLKSYKE